MAAREVDDAPVPSDAVAADPAPELTPAVEPAVPAAPAPAPVAEPDALAAPPAPAAAAAPQDGQDLGYDVGAWQGLPHYSCRQCPFDTLHEDQIVAHLAAHAAPPAPAVVPEVRVDRFGNVVGGAIGAAE